MAKKNAKKKAIDEAAALAAEEDEFELEDLGGLCCTFCNRNN